MKDMKEACWDDCIASKNALRVSPDPSKSKSLAEISKGRIDFLSNLKTTESNANYIFEGYYSSLLELMHAILLLEGYKVGNHICVGFYLKDIMKREDLFNSFDDCRYKRNSLVYYGRSMEFEIAKDAVDKCKRLIMELEKIIKDKTKN